MFQSVRCRTLVLCALHFASYIHLVAASNTVRAFCYLEQVNDEQNKISLTDSRIVIKYRNKIDSYELPTIKDLTFGHRKAMLYLISGGIAVPFTAVAFYRDFLNPWPTLFLLFSGVFAIYLGWRGYQVLTIHLFGFDRDYRLTSVSENMVAFVSFALKFLPINLPLTDNSEPLIYHITDVSTWNQTKTETNFKGDTKDGFIHASTGSRLKVPVRNISKVENIYS